MSHPGSAAKAIPPALYTPEQRARRDATAWTLVQGVLAPIQFLVFLVSLVLVLRCMATGEGEQWALWSVVIKTLTLYTIMVTGCIWEKVVFGQYLFAPAFLWEDIFSMLVLALHTLYLFGWWNQNMSLQQQLSVALLAYFTYCINAGQFIWKLRAARLQQAREKQNFSGAGMVGAGAVA
ncbi:BchF, 2-vinyl bacteriochlorophyllide hydratase [Burkholderiaceae bacterium]